MTNKDGKNPNLTKAQRWAEMGYELTKLASKIVRLREFAGIYYRSDYVESIIM